MKVKERLLNYAFSLGFVVIILLFLISIVLISRFVLEDASPIGEHVNTTRTLLDDIEEVERSVEISKELRSYDNFNIEQLKCNHYEQEVSDISYLNIHDNKSIISLVFDSPINVINNSYYIKVNDANRLDVGDNIIIQKNGNIYYGQIFNINDEGFKVINFENKGKMDIQFENILGKIIVRHEND